MNNGPSTRARIFGTTLLLLWLPMLVAYGVVRGRAVEETETATRELLEGHVRLIAALVEQVEVQAENDAAWQKLVEQLASRSRTGVALVSNGRRQEVVAQSWPGQPSFVPGTEVTGALSRGMAFSHRTEADGAQWLALAVPWLVDGAVNGAIVVMAPLTESELVERLEYGLLLGLLGGGGLALLVALTAARIASRSAKSLIEVASSMASGDLNARTAATGNDEFAVLGRGLDALAESLSDKVRELRTGKDRLDRVLSSMHEGVLLVDRSGYVQLVNSALVEMLYLAPQPVGKHVDEVVEHPELVDLLELAQAGESQSAELTLDKLPGRSILAGVRSLPNEGGVLMVLVDITEQRRLETVRQEFVANASHELRTPVAAIISAAETLETIWENAEGSNFISMISRNAHRLRALVDDLLALSHIESGTIEIELVPVNLRRTVEAIMNDFTPAAREKKTELICLVPSDVVVMASLPGLQHVIGNLVDNAIKYSPAGSKVRVEARKEELSAVLTVRDDGPGIPAEHRQRIFERFYRVDAGRSRALGGTGLGLSIVKHWVEAMEGTIRVAEAKPRGTAFFVTLAIATHEATVATTEA